MPLFDLKKQLVFYGAYHADPTNVKIHITCVPILLATGFLFATNTPSLRTPPLLTKLHLPLNLGTLAATTYSTLYLLLSPNVAGAALAPLVMAAGALANYLTATYNRRKANTVAVGVHVVCWILQFIGHGKFEGRKPALLDNLVQALFLAPMFVWYEVLFKFGFYKELRKEVEERVAAERRKLKEGKKGE
ncbi:DUF962-domain-containing protein [Trematosphaeria pertusa]|uniref:DUF962-domain-containing protein n=1 Tax=Trematosphaeria pertusa TaxID=390896 RepID=A0A6A6I721_9PLEO|nr:DUF962-domain-containing protein [Trematosphaeria pertusa]KAF2246029.1 DUF962-domain-containing protein [Trematosphaeria pertusa]